MNAKPEIPEKSTFQQSHSEEREARRRISKLLHHILARFLIALRTTNYQTLSMVPSKRRLLECLRPIVGQPRGKARLWFKVEQTPKNAGVAKTIRKCDYRARNLGVNSAAIGGFWEKSLDNLVVSSYYYVVTGSNC
jgi:hypothetical protein